MSASETVGGYTYAATPMRLPLSTSSQKSKTWKSDASLSIPSASILDFAFGNTSTYDQDKPIFADAENPAKSISARLARAVIRQLVKGLKEQGLQTGDCVCLHAFNNIYYPLLWLGVIGAGGCVSGSNPAYTSLELIHHFSVTETKYVISQADCSRSVSEAAAQCQIDPNQIFILDDDGADLSPSHDSWLQLLKCGEQDWVHFGENEEESKKTIAVYGTTSGTSGLPKAALIAHQYVVAQSLMLEDQLKDRPYEAKQLMCLPVFHAFAAQLALVLPLRLGITTYFLPRFKPREFARAVSSFGITDAAVVPPVITALLDLDHAERASLESIRYVVCAGAPMSAEVQSRLYEYISPSATISQVWGATELGWVTLFNWKEKDTSGSVGRLAANTELKIIDEDGTPVGEDDVHGEACIRSSSMFDGYRNNSSATKDSIDSEGFYHTGDRVYMEDGKVFIDGRMKDIMKVKVNGWQVSPTELETILLQHPLIADAVVVGFTRRNDKGLEETLPRAYVVRRAIGPLRPVSIAFPADITTEIDGLSLTEQEVKDFVADRVVSYKKLSGGVSFVNKIPRSATGKVLRRLLPGLRPNLMRLSSRAPPDFNVKQAIPRLSALGVAEMKIELEESLGLGKAITL